MVRISPFDSAQARRHTAFASVTAVPEIDDSIDVEINERRSANRHLSRSSGAGGQHVNKTDSAVRLTHVPTGIVVAMPERAFSTQEQSASAMKMMRAHLFERERRRAQQAEDRRTHGRETLEIGFGSQIRSYTLASATAGQGPSDRSSRSGNVERRARWRSSTRFHPQRRYCSTPWIASP